MSIHHTALKVTPIPSLLHPPIPPGSFSTPHNAAERFLCTHHSPKLKVLLVYFTVPYIVYCRVYTVLWILYCTFMYYICTVLYIVHLVQPCKNMSPCNQWLCKIFVLQVVSIQNIYCCDYVVFKANLGGAIWSILASSFLTFWPTLAPFL